MVEKMTNRIQKGIRLLTRILKKIGRFLQRLGIPVFYVKKEIPLKNILRGGECALSANKYARLVGKPLRASQRVIAGPHVKFLTDYKKNGRMVLEKSFFENTEYYQEGAESISYGGSYLVKYPSKIVDVARNFLNDYDGQPSANPSLKHTCDPYIKVRRIRNSSCYELIDGHHRVAVAFMRGQNTIKARVLLRPSSTPAQDMLADVLWQGGRVELYQPVDLPEVAEWPILRRCTDRFQLMQNFLTKIGKQNSSYVDIGAAYGWFVKEFLKSGYDAYGVERDSFSIKIASEIYGLSANRFYRDDIVDFLSRNKNSYDIVSCFSVAHHFVLGRASISAEALVEYLDKITRDVLFFDTGECHEEWHKSFAALSKWDPDYIENFLKTHTKFSTIVRLGKDQDNYGDNRGNYGRTLFACTRS